MKKTYIDVPFNCLICGLNDADKLKMIEMNERIWIREKYEPLAKRGKFTEDE